MSSVITAKDRFPWRKSQIRDITIFLVVTVLGAAALVWSLVTNFEGFPLPIAIVIFLVGLLVVLVSLIGNNLAKSNSAVFADMNSDTYHVNFWMKKPTVAIWGDRLNRTRNQGDLTKFVTLDVTKVGKYTVLVFELEDKKKIYLPDRLYNKAEVRDFLLRWMESRNNQINAKSKEAMTVFAGVLNEGRKLTPSDKPADSADTK